MIEALNLGYEVLREHNPAIIYARLRGFGLSGPYAHSRCFDPLAQAAAGALSVTDEPGGPPVKPGPTVADAELGLGDAELEELQAERVVDNRTRAAGRVSVARV